MNSDIRKILALLMALVIMTCMTACAGGGDEEAADAGNEAAAETADADGGQDAESEGAEEAVAVVKTIEGIDEDLGPRLPLMIDTITLYEDGTVAIVPTEDLRKNEIKDDSDAVYPFEESGKVSDVYVVDYGNAGYRTIIALLKDGTISAVNGRALVEDHIFAVMDDVANRDNFVSVENVTDESGSGIIATTDTGEEVILDYSLNFDQPE